jgi:hypothetical protein
MAQKTVSHSPRTAAASNIRRENSAAAVKQTLPEAFGVLAENSAGSGQSNTSNQSSCPENSAGLGRNGCPKPEIFRAGEKSGGLMRQDDTICKRLCTFSLSDRVVHCQLMFE